MQRRAAAIYVVFFVLVAVGAYSLTTVAEEPSISVAGQNYSAGESLSVNGTEWTVNVAGGEGNVTTVNESARLTTSLANNSTVVFSNGSYRPAPNGSAGGTTGTANGSATGTNASGAPANATATGARAGPANNDTTPTRLRVLIANTSADNATGGNASVGNGSTNASNGTAANVSSFTLREQFATSTRLQTDPSVANTTLAGNGTRYVRYRNGTIQPLDEYLPDRETRTVSVGDSFPYRNNSTTVASVNTTGATLAWEGTLTRSMGLAAGENVTFGGTTYVPVFPTNETVTLSQNVAAYQEEQAAISDFDDRILGLWGVVIISLFAAVLVAGLAYMPVRG